MSGQLTPMGISTKRKFIWNQGQVQEPYLAGQPFEQQSKSIGFSSLNGKKLVDSQLECCSESNNTEISETPRNILRQTTVKQQPMALNNKTQQIMSRLFPESNRSTSSSTSLYLNQTAFSVTPQYTTIKTPEEGTKTQILFNRLTESSHQPSYNSINST